MKQTFQLPIKIIPLFPLPVALLLYSSDIQALILKENAKKKKALA